MISEAPVNRRLALFSATALLAGVCSTAPVTQAVAEPPEATAGVQGGVQGPSVRDACTDTALTLTVPGTTPTVGSSGTVTVTDTNTDTVADRIDLADPASYQRTIGGATNTDGTLHAFAYHPITVDGDTAAIHLHH